MLSLLLAATITIPLSPPNDQGPWITPRFDKVRPNTVVSVPEGIAIQVDDSSSFQLYRLNELPQVARIKVRGSLKGMPHWPEGTEEGVPRKSDDFALRVGIVEAGTDRLSWFQRILAPKWLKNLESLLPDSGVKKIRLFTISRFLEKGFHRTHPLSKKIEEDVAFRAPHEEGPFELEGNFSEPVTAVAIWLQADGDDSHSSFQTTIQSLVLETAEAVTH